MAKFSIVITSPAVDSASAYSAYRFANAALKQGHSVLGVFFYQGGVTVANQFQTVLSDELNILDKWQSLARQYDIPLQVCVTAANRRGVISQLDAKQDRQQLDHNLTPPFESVGLGELVTLLNDADRSVQF
ncbi:sulfurtransferase complex subunit TusD [Aliiglaciecola sp. LCG003]|uniref:sulfurtransferase complex subunit TusD n=1 Tax=Aliiglaciecola sp. LCG003 TaxID=3053655 RepID=UPI0025727DF2|nr:sulfurtransferase complex subunit TusD [Aliiglaciecola sp. LCG003]WJG11177.1 sulfurtransferase complex subunit TusD [Aliiglaciecola sp. LCG003]